MAEIRIKAVKPGAILVSSWGYDQTNVDWYMVTKGAEVGKMVELVRLAAHVTGSLPMAMSGISYSEKVAGQFQPYIGAKPAKKKLQQAYDGNVSVKVRSFALVRLRDGKPKGCSWYA